MFSTYQIDKSGHNSRVFSILKKLVLTLFAHTKENLRGSLIFKLKKVEVLTFPQSGLEKTPWELRGPHGTVCQAQAKRLALVCSAHHTLQVPKGPGFPGPMSAPPCVK